VKNGIFSDRIMGVETPTPPIMIFTAAPDGAPPRRIRDDNNILKHYTAPPGLGEALRRGGLVNLFACTKPQFN
jgi:hypothetical protein